MEDAPSTSGRQTSSELPNYSLGVVPIPTAESLAATDSVMAARQKNTEAQRRFRARLKENKLSLARQLEEVNAKLQDLMSDKKELERSQNMISHVLTAQFTHIEQLFSHQAVRDVQQTLLLHEMSLVVGKVQGRKVPMEEAARWTMHQWISQHFQEYISKIALLYKEASSTGAPRAAAELQELLTMRREQETLGEQFSCFSWALLSWNLEETSRSASPPAKAQHALALDGLRLLPQQKQAIYKARQSLVGKLRAIAVERAHIVSQLGIQLLDFQREQIHLCPATQQLWDSLDKEREAVLTFMITICDNTLTPVQEAWLDSFCFPWAPDVWQLSGLLAEQLEPQDSLAFDPASLDVPGRALEPILPFMSAFRFLTTPITAAGAGLRFKRGIVLNPCFTKESSLAFPRPSQKVLRDMPLLAVNAGAWKKLTYWQWKQACEQAGGLIPNEPTEDDILPIRSGSAPVLSACVQSVRDQKKDG